MVERARAADVVLAIGTRLAEITTLGYTVPNSGAALIHVARAVCRRAERDALAAPVNPQAVVYLNRVSDLLYILARSANAAAGRDEPLWKPGASR